MKKKWKNNQQKNILIHLGYPYQFFCYEGFIQKR
jgi:hypothetical protein